MTGDAEQRLSAALRAQAAGLGAGSPTGAGFSRADPEPTGTGYTGSEGDSPPTRPRLPAWAVLVLAVLLGALAGGLAGAISVW